MSRPNHIDLFSTTRWTMVVRAGGSGQTAADALEDLCRTYWFPLYAYVRGRGFEREDAQDLTQGFFQSLLQKRDLSSLNAEKGRFRAFLLASLKHYMANDYDRAGRLKRGGGQTLLSLDWEEAGLKFDAMDTRALAPDRMFDREWALALLNRVMERLADEWTAKGKADAFDLVREFLSMEGCDARYTDIARQSGMNESSLRVMAHRLRKRYRRLLKDEIAHTLADPAMVDEELASLMKAFD